MIVNEIFLSIQGEGEGVGKPTVFVRLTGCNLRCTWCDTEYAFYEGKDMSIREIMKEVEKYGIGRVCITGGEPLLQKESLELTDRLIEKGYEVSIETNGSLPIEGINKKAVISMDWKTPSSGETEKMRKENLKYLEEKDQLKFVIAGEEDYTYSRNFLEENREKIGCEIIFQPLGGLNIKWLAKRILEDKMDIRVLPQLHKIIWGEEKGV